jgi:hypothetical protein
MIFTRTSQWTVKYCPTEDTRRGACFSVSDVHKLQSGGKRTDFVAEWVPTGTVFHESNNNCYLVATSSRVYLPTPWVGSEDKQATKQTARTYSGATDLLIWHTPHNRGGARNSWKAVKCG